MYDKQHRNFDKVIKYCNTLVIKIMQHFLQMEKKGCKFQKLLKNSVKTPKIENKCCKK